MVWYGMVLYGMAWHGMVWYCMVLYGMVWYGIDVKPYSLPIPTLNCNLSPTLKE